MLQRQRYLLHGGPPPDGCQDSNQLCFTGVNGMAIGGSHHLEIQLTGQTQQSFIQSTVHVRSHRLQLDKKEFPAKNLHIFGSIRFCPLLVFFEEPSRDFSPMATAHNYEPLVVLIKLIRRYARFLLPALGVGFSDKLKKILVAFAIPG